MSELPDPPGRHAPTLWPAIVLGLLVLLCVAGLALQFGAWRSETADRAQISEGIPEPPPPNDAGERKAPPRPGGDLPAFGEYVYVEELPEALTRTPPEYPEAALQANVEGTVVVQALIGTDGLVKDTKVVRAVPPLDDAAVAAVEKWTFKPARARGEPVAVWVAVPVRFSLN